jgi:pimeloyl-ACP methyl ester carboxylesterase
MSAKPVDEHRIAPLRGLEEPFYFRSGDHTLFGWLHSAAVETTASVGMVICKPFGFESISSHRSTRAFADAAAGIGVSTLRFDYVGTGDSEDLDARADQIENWTQDIVAAVGELRRRTGVRRVCLLGFRFGALLAALAAARCECLSAMLLIAPVISGKKYLRELRTLELAGSSANAAATLAGLGHGDGAAGSLEVSGFMLSAESIAKLAQIDVMAIGEPPVSELFIIDRTDLPAARPWADRMNALGLRVQYQSLPGSVEMLMVAPQLAVIPRAMIAATCEWLARFQLPASDSASVADRRDPVAGQSAFQFHVTLHSDSGAEAPDEKVTERPVFFATEPTLFGIVTEPRNNELRRRAVILLNSGGDYHIGPRRMHVSLARRWAQRGYVVLRMDLEGLGDSATRIGRPDNEIFPPGAVSDVSAAIDFLRTHYAVGDITLGGLCSGAYHTLRAAVAGLPINRIFMINPQNFYWDEGKKLDDLQLVEIVNHPSAYSERLFAASTWKRLLYGRIDVWRIAQIYSRRAWLALESIIRDAARWLHIGLPNDLGSELEKVAALGIRVVFVFSRGDVGINLLRIQGGSSVKRLGDRCRIHVIDGADHDFTRSGPRAELENVLSEELFVRHQ